MNNLRIVDSHGKSLCGRSLGCQNIFSSGQIAKIKTDCANSENPVIIFHNRILKTSENNPVSAVIGADSSNEDGQGGDIAFASL